MKVAFMLNRSVLIKFLNVIERKLANVVKKQKWLSLKYKYILHIFQKNLKVLMMVADLL